MAYEQVKGCKDPLHYWPGLKKMDIYNELVKDGDKTMLNQCASNRNKVPQRQSKQK